MNTVNEGETRGAPRGSQFMKGKSYLYEALRWLCAALIIAVILGHGLKNRVSGADFNAVKDAVVPTVLSDRMQEADAQLIKRLYGVNPADYEGCALFAPVSNMDAEELLLVKLSDLSQRDALTAAVEQRLQTQKNAFDGYGAAQFALLNDHAAVEVRGNYILFVVSENEAAARAAFTAAL